MGTMRRGTDGRCWRPEIGTERPWGELAAGDLIAVLGRVWRLRAVQAVPAGRWDGYDWHHFLRDGAGPGGQVWPRRPLYLDVELPGGGGRRRIKVRTYMPGAADGCWVVPDHYPVCAQCGQPWPCRGHDIERTVRAEAAELDRVTSIPPGCCWECGQPVTRRQRAVTFDGENLLLPGAAPAMFHLRRKRCAAAAAAYENDWVAARPGHRKRKLRFPGCPAGCAADGACAGPGCTAAARRQALPSCAGPHQRAAARRLLRQSRTGSRAREPCAETAAGNPGQERDGAYPARLDWRAPRGPEAQPALRAAQNRLPCTAAQLRPGNDWRLLPIYTPDRNCVMSA